jgi:prepilin-type N-terminal cleavage/methylation domain-containing protein
MQSGTQRKRGRGFSLLELLVVIAAICVIASMSIPALNSVRNSYRLSAARDELIGVFEVARSSAIKLDSNTSVTLTNSDTYRIQYTANGVTQSIAYSLPNGVSFNLPSGMTSVTIECRPSGKVTMTGSNGASVTSFTITNSMGSRTVSINLAGNITVAAT